MLFCLKNGVILCNIIKVTGVRKEVTWGKQPAKRQSWENTIQIALLYCLSSNYPGQEQTGVKEVALPGISVNPRAEIAGCAPPVASHPAPL